jgi:hypothetical protein
VVENSLHYPKVKGSSPDTNGGSGVRKMAIGSIDTMVTQWLITCFIIPRSRVQVQIPKMALGKGKWQKVALRHNGSTVVEHLPSYPKVKGSSPDTNGGSGVRKWQKQALTQW